MTDVSVEQGDVKANEGKARLASFPFCFFFWFPPLSLSLQIFILTVMHKKLRPSIDCIGKYVENSIREGYLS